MSKRILGFITSIFAGMFLVSVAMAAPVAKAKNGEQTFSPTQTKQIEKIVHDYLVQNPQVMVQVFSALKQQEQKQMQEQAEKAIKDNAKTLFSSPNSPVVGNAKGTVTLVEFFDYQCPHCKRMTPVIEKLVKNNPELRVVYKELPIFPGSAYISSAALAAQQQGKYLAFHNALMAVKDPITKESVIEIAKKVGLNIPELKKAMNSKKVKAELTDNLKLAQALALVGTPAFIVGSHVNDPSKIKTYFIPGQVPGKVLQNFIQQAAN